MKILIIRFSSIGDIVLTTPVIRCCKSQLKESEVHFLTKPSFAYLVKNNPYVDQVWTLDDNLNALAQELKLAAFDYVIDLHNNLRTRHLSLLMRRRFLRFDKLNLRKWMFVNKLVSTMPEIHIVDRYFKTVEQLNVKNDGKGLDYFIPDDTAVPTLKQGQKFVCFAIGGQHATKKLPAESIRTLCQNIEVSVVLIGGREDEAVGQLVAQGLNNVTSLCGLLTVDQSAMVIMLSDQVISHDTGMMHIASALGKRISTIWGNTVPSFGMFALGAHPASVNYEVEGLRCRPCSKIGHDTCPNGHFKCMKNQNIDEIALSAINFFGREQQ